MNTRTWPYGTQFKAEVAYRDHYVLSVVANGEGFVLVGQNSFPEDAKVGDKGTLTFMKGGPMGGFWKFEKEQRQTGVEAS